MGARYLMYLLNARGEKLAARVMTEDERMHASLSWVTWYRLDDAPPIEHWQGVSHYRPDQLQLALTR